MLKGKRTMIAPLILVMILSGCWDVKDIDKRVLPLVMGITKESNDEYKVTMQIPIQKKEGETSRLVTSIDKNVSSALGQIKTNSENAVDYTQVRLIVVHESISESKEELVKLVTFLMNSSDIPTNAQLAFTNAPIEDLLSNINDKLGVDSTSLYDFFNKGTGWAPEIISTRIWEIYRSLHSFTEDTTIPVVDAGDDTVLMYKGAAALKGGEITQSIKRNETLLIKLFQDESVNGKIENVDFATIMMISSDIQNTPSIKDDQPVLTSDVKFKIRILEREPGVTNDRIKKAFEKLIEERFYNMFSKVQDSQTDVFGFGQHFRGVLPYKDLEHWREQYYPELKVRFRVHAGLE